MSSTHLSLHYHIVFGTKNHEPIIELTWPSDLHTYLGGIICTANGIAESVGGVSDHVHLLIGLRATHRLDDTGGLHHRLISSDPSGLLVCVVT